MKNWSSLFLQRLTGEKYADYWIIYASYMYPRPLMISHTFYLSNIHHEIWPTRSDYLVPVFSNASVAKSRKLQNYLSIARIDASEKERVISELLTTDKETHSTVLKGMEIKFSDWYDNYHSDAVASCLYVRFSLELGTYTHTFPYL